MEACEFVYREHGGSWTFSQMRDKAGVGRSWVTFSSKAGHIVSVLFLPMTWLLPAPLPSSCGHSFQSEGSHQGGPQLGEIVSGLSHTLAQMGLTPG